MSHYNLGDIVLIPYPSKGKPIKIRPAIVIALQSEGYLHLCQIRNSPRTGTICIQISIDDFIEGGLNPFSESYVQVDTVLCVKNGIVIGKKGRVTKECLLEIRERVQQ